MDYMRTPEFWLDNEHKSGEQLAREFGGDGAHWRRAKRKHMGATTPDVTIQRGIAVFDLHHPSHDKKLWKNILRFTEDFAPDIFAFGGDNMDLEVISHWNENKRLRVEGKRLKADYKKFTHEVLDPLDAVLGEDTRRVWHFGNHEDWVNQYIEVHPEMEGLIEIEEHLDLSKWETYEYGEVSKYGHLHMTHGTYINLHNAYKTAQVYGRSMMYGHGHTLQAHTLVTPLDSLPYMAMQIPCACHTNPHYRKNQPNGWVSGFAVFYVQADGQYNLFPVVAIDGAFVAPNGVLYD